MIIAVKSVMSITHACVILLLLLQPQVTTAQKKHQKVSLKDSLDGALDLSSYLIDANGFVPIPIPITDQALGGFGMAIVPVFIKQRPPYVDTIKGKVVKTPVAPDVTGGIGLYTVNKSWGADVFRAGTLVKSRIKYIVNVGYFNINMSFYRKLEQLGEQKFDFNFKAAPVYVQAIRRLGFSKWYAGLKYLLLNVEVKYEGDQLLPPELVKNSEKKILLSVPGAIIELDNRDNNFTPDKGIKFHVDAQCSNSAFGSDYDYWRMNYYAYMYKKISSKLTGGWRLDGQQTFDDVPFFLQPYIDMRGIPAMRYQGKADVLTEVEARWDVTRRWSVMFFGGTGKAFNDWNEFGSADWVYSFGTGFRYLLARKFKLRTGIDVAKGPPGSWGYYIVFGSAWLK